MDSLGASDSIRVRSPYDDRLLGEVPRATAVDVDVAVERARAAFRGALKEMTSLDRAELLRAVAHRLEDRADDVAELITAESGKVVRESRGEVARALSTLDYAAGEAVRIHGSIFPCDVVPGAGDKEAQLRWVPVGIVGAITPFNFPLNTVVHKVAPAIAAGNAVVLTPSPQTPLTAELLLEIVADAGAPEGLLSCVHGDAECGEALVSHEHVRMISFTGSVAVGERVARLAGIKKVALELGGNDPLIVCVDADVEAAVDVAVEQGLGTCGQRCTAVKRVLLEEEIADEFVELLLERVRSLIVGDPADPVTDIGPMISADALDRVERRVQQAREAGADVLAQGAREGNILPPIVLGNVDPGCELVTEETFGPVLPIMRFDSLDRCVEIVNSTRFGLQAGVFTNRLDTIRRLRDEVEVGALIVNAGPGYRVDSLPFGGVKSSGVGREGVIAAVREMSEPRLLVS